MASTTIEWTDHSINPIRFGRGHFCQKISPGCVNCYASRLQPRFGNAEFKGAGSPKPFVRLHGSGGKDREALWLDKTKLQEVLRRTKPTKFFWCDMTDLFGEWVPDEWIDRCFSAMALTPQHVHQVLTKRPERMRDYLMQRALSAKPWIEAARSLGWSLEFMELPLVRFPLPNVWVGVSVENQAMADARIPPLLQTPAAVRFLSCEPLLGALNLVRWLTPFHGLHAQHAECDWVIVGGESGSHARLCDVAWIRSLVHQCQAAEVTCFVKQLGSQPVWNHVVPGCSVREALEPLCLKDARGGNPDEWPEDLRVREFPKATARAR